MSTLTTTVQDSWPPRVLLSATGLAAPVFVRINRIVGGARTAVRGADQVFVASTAFTVVDAEQPFGVPVTYELQESSAVQDTTTPETFTLPGGKVALSDAVSGLAAEVVVLAHDDLVRDGEVTVFRIDGQNYPVGDKIGQWVATWEFYTETTTAHDNLMALLEQATSGIVLMRQPGGYAGVDAYVAPLTARTRRWSQDGSDERRVTAVQLAETSAWSDGLLAAGYTLQNVADAYTGQTLTQLAADYPTLLALAQGDFS